MSDDPNAWTTPDGDAARHLPMDELEQRLATLPPAPKDRGSVEAIFARPGSNQRLGLPRAKLTAADGVPGDRWADKRDEQGEKIPDQMLAVMQIDIARLIANGQPIGLFGDNLFLDLDLTEANLPVGTRVRVGQALLEVTPEPHDGCRKFKGRFGGDALKLVARKEDRHRNLRGIYFKVVEDGEVAEGDAALVLRD